MDFSVGRRGFVQMGAMAASAAWLPECEAMVSSAGAGVSARVRLGIASYTFRSFTRAQLIEFAKKLEISTLNLKDVKDHLPLSPVNEEMKAVADYKAAGLTLTAAGTIYFKKDEDEDIRAKFEYCKRAGVKVIVAGDPPVAVLPRIEKFVKAYDIRFAVHNHGPEDPLWHSPLDVLQAVKAMDPRMGCCMDVGHAMRAGDDVVKTIRTVGPRLFNMHMKDLAEANAKESQVAVGRGVMPVKEIFAELMAMKYAGNVDLEYEIHADDPLPGVIESFAYMRGVLAGMAKG